MILNIDYFTKFNDKLYFTADDGKNGNEIWVTDGTAEGTKLFADITDGSSSSEPRFLTVFNHELFFTANNGETGNELFKLTLPDSTPMVSKGEILLEGRGNDTLNGGAGADTLIGSAGNDEMSGRDGDD